ncbi:MAG: 30S ribosomal protein S7 [Candidatus Altiarchaeales archaeon HGW-Altiarchaeales-3]|nr:MAG: 30S ribosomal protein S7 [Candidatus Altiarchaeales archaeon HGW-Altiarchaeales-3]
MAIKLFDRWDFDGIEVKDPGMERYISLRPTYIPHTAGRLSGKIFSKSKMNIVERLSNKLMRSGQGTKKVAGRFIRGGGNTGSKQNALKIVKGAFEIIEKKTKKSPIQVLVDALINAGPREETTTIIYGGIRYHQAVDVSAQRRVDFGLRYLALGAFATSFNKKNRIEDCLANEIILAANNDNKAYAISRKEETERIAHSAR